LPSFKAVRLTVSVPGYVDSLSLHVQALFRHVSSLLPQISVVCRRAVPRNHADLIPSPQFFIYAIEKFDGADIDSRHFIGVVTAQDPVDFAQRLVIVLAVPGPVGNGQFFIDVDIEEGESPLG
jgi:hypothetical protein